MSQEDSESSSDSDSDDYGPQLTTQSTTKKQAEPPKDTKESNSTNSAQGSLDTNNDNNDTNESKKRKREEIETETEQEEKEEPLSKKQRLDIDLERLPSSEMYEYSWMHRNTVTHVIMAQNYDFLITASIDGVIKFWKKNEMGIEFVKEYRGHNDYIQCMEINSDETLLITIGNDKNVCIFDIITFDMMTRFELTYYIGIICWIGTSQIAITEKNTSIIRIYKPIKNQNKHIYELTNIHNTNTKILNIKYNKLFNYCISTDLLGNIELWNCEYPFERPSNNYISFEYILETDLILYKRDNIIPISITISNNCKFLVILSNDNYIRLFRLTTGKLLFKINENIIEYQKNNNLIYKIDSIEFGKHVAVERQINKELNDNIYNNNKLWLCSNIIFDTNDKHIIYSTMIGIKIINITNENYTKPILCRLLGKQETNVRFLNIALFQGIPNINNISQSQKFKNLNNIIDINTITDPTIFVTGYNMNRFYMFSNRTNKTDEHRDIQNEKPTRMHSKIATHATHRTLGKSAVIRTTFGDIYIKLFPIECPKTVENFTVHSLNGYFNNVIFHRVIRGFMIQTGDPKGDSTGGKSIWGSVFDDEFHRSLKHDRPGTVSMANAGKNTNGSQFFITTTEAKWLDNKHTIFGRVTKGMDVVQAIETVKVDKVTKKPVEDIKIINISIEKI